MECLSTLSKIQRYPHNTLKWNQSPSFGFIYFSLGALFFFFCHFPFPLFFFTIAWSSLLEKISLFHLFSLLLFFLLSCIDLPCHLSICATMWSPFCSPTFTCGHFCVQNKWNYFLLSVAIGRICYLLAQYCVSMRCLYENLLINSLSSICPYFDATDLSG